MTVFRGTPVSEGVAAGELYLPDAARSGALVQAEARAWRAAARGPMTFRRLRRRRRGTRRARRAAPRGRARRRGRHRGDRRADRGRPGPVRPRGGRGAGGHPRRGRRARRRGSPGRDPRGASRPGPGAARERRPPGRRGGHRPAGRRAAGAAGRPVHPGPPRGRPGRPDPARRRRSLAGAVSVGGGASSHAAIIARGLGLPMLAGADPAVLTAAAGHPAILDARRASWSSTRRRRTWPASQAATAIPLITQGAGAEAASGQAHTADGEPVTVLCNVASAAETRLGLANGAAGVGLLRTEIPFTARAAGRPRRPPGALGPSSACCGQAGGRPAARLRRRQGPAVPRRRRPARVPRRPGRARRPARRDPEAGAGTDLAIMIPMVRSLDEVRHVRAELARAAKAAGTDPPPLGMMVELAATAAPRQLRGARRFLLDRHERSDG